jgi:hypothetical protein
LHSFISCLLALACALPALAQQPASLEGTRFVFAVPQNFRNDHERLGVVPAKPAHPSNIVIALSAKQATKVRIVVPSVVDTTVSVGTGAVSYVSVDAARTEVSRTAQAPSNRSFTITSLQPVSATVTSVRYQTTESFRPWPVELLGTEYRLMCYTKLAPDLLSTATVTAIEDNTDVTIEPSTALEAEGATVRLQAGQTLGLSAKWESNGTCDLTGTLVRSSKPVSVVSGHTCAYVPVRIEACNVLLEQMPPVNRWGDQHFTSVPYNRSLGTVRILAHYDDTRLSISEHDPVVLAAGQFHELSSAKPMAILSTQPVLVASFSQGFKNGDSVGDPSYAIVTPASMMGTEGRIFSPVPIELWDAAALITGPTTAIEAFRASIAAGAELDRQSTDGQVSTVAVTISHVAQLLRVPPGCSVSLWGTGKRNGLMAFDAWSYTPMWAPTKSR